MQSHCFCEGKNSKSTPSSDDDDDDDFLSSRNLQKSVIESAFRFMCFRTFRQKKYRKHFYRFCFLPLKKRIEAKKIPLKNYRIRRFLRFLAGFNVFIFFKRSAQFEICEAKTREKTLP